MKKGLLLVLSFTLTVSISSACAPDSEVCVWVDNFVDNAESGSVTFDLMMSNSVDVGGFQFDLLSDDMMSGLSFGDGLATANGFTISASGNRALGFSFSGTSIGVQSGGVLCQVTASYDIANIETLANIWAYEECIQNGCNRLLFSDTGAQALSTEWITSAWEVGNSTLGFDGNLIYEFSLSDNYPNPFNPVTNINYSIPAYGEVSLLVFDALGRQVKSLVSGQMSPGQYAVTWDGTDSDGVELSSGMYFYRLTSGGFSKTNKMMFVK